MGIVRQQYPPSYVPASPQPVKMEVLPPFETSVNVDHTAKQEVIVTTNAVDRSKGFQLMITPIALVVAVLAVLVSLLFESEFLSFASLLIFWLTFCAVYVGGWVMTALATPEAVSLYSAKRQWDIVEREQKERWSHYRWQSGRTLEDKRTIDPQYHQSETSPLWAFLERYGVWLILVGLAYGTLALFVLMNLGGE